MSDSHFTCEGDSILTRACRKSPSVAFASHTFGGKSGTYSDLGGKPPRRGRMKRLVLAGALAVVAAGQTLASDLPPPSPVPPPRAPAAYMPPITQSITGAASISASISTTALAAANGRIPPTFLTRVRRLATSI